MGSSPSVSQCFSRSVTAKSTPQLYAGHGTGLVGGAIGCADVVLPKVFESVTQELLQSPAMRWPVPVCGWVWSTRKDMSSLMVLREGNDYGGRVLYERCQLSSRN